MGCARGIGVFAFFSFVGTSLLTGQALPPTHVDDFTGHPRVVIISDIGNEPDDQMSFVRLLLYSNELDLEALIATTSTWQKTATHPETMRAIVQAYGQVRSNLLLHAQGWPTAGELDRHIFAGQAAYGMAATGKGKASAGSQALMKAIELRKKSATELQNELISLRKEQFALRLQRSTGQAVKPDQFSKVRRNIARVKTVQRAARAGDKS